ncbi:MAG: methyl-accepting chemotaxis protein [Thermodesulfobacteriota bacterium]|jgi:methyl-accepting chemotaxis protein
MRRAKRTLGMRTKLFVAGLAAVLLASLSLGIYALRRGEEAILTSVEAQLAEDARRASQRIVEVIDDSAGDLSIWARLDVAPQTLDNEAPKFFVEFARQSVMQKGIYAHMVLALPDGTLFAMNEVDRDGEAIATHPLPRASFGDQEWFRTALGSAQVTLAGPLVPEALVKAVRDGAPVGRELLLSHPVLDIMDDTVGLWISGLDWSWFGQYLDHLVSREDGRVNRFPLLLDGAGEVIGTGPAAALGREAAGAFADRLAGSPGGVREFELDGRRYFGVAAEVRPERIADFPGWRIAVVQDRAAALAPVARFRNRVIGVGVAVSIAISAMLLLALQRAVQQVTRPLMDLGHSIQRMGEGDLSVRVAAASDPEMARLAEAFNETVGVLDTAIGEVETTSKGVRRSVQAVTSAIENFGSQEKDLSGATASAAAASQQMAASVEHVAATCNDLEQMACESKDLAGDGEHRMDESRNAVTEMVEAIDGVIGAMEKLNSHMDGIRGISGSIEDIADLTNLLALNAAIEAARAGEHGRGFAVVASEVKKLAEQSSRATRQILTLVKEVREVSKEVSERVDAARERSRMGLDTTGQATEALRRIRAATENTTARILEIATSMEEQSRAAPEVPRLIARVEELLVNTKNDLGQASEEVLHLSEASVRLDALLERFHRSGSAPS